jgi:hypothetical protein
MKAVMLAKPWLYREITPEQSGVAVNFDMNIIDNSGL